ncbi:helix-turn-helix transcriptional regulator [Enterobacter hormaechei]|nr:MULTISPECIES: helix-turn-helix transcriptional regulator [Enterobacter]MBU8926385.1 helix-turn-helix transcriptional regulator [Enterobacter hormaechei]MBU8930847.1 helix-turn-helix transcriptional regulator [Enterobacter hormaechei]MBU8938073.1 helix-turn-helix transcriptional regulator [Enterobacter hormaechei]MBU8947531.1 helix-turn-helix transcriptional regulator [Enterobacter hormaechei]MBV1668406.1 helix-turn-helix transcriptional regulator [Enterobacter hormaechei]
MKTLLTSRCINQRGAGQAACYVDNEMVGFISKFHPGPKVTFLAMCESYMKLFQKRLRHAFTELGMNLSELARLLEVSPQAVQRWCRGLSIPRKITMDKLATIAGRPVSWFYSTYEDETSLAREHHVSQCSTTSLTDNKAVLVLSPDEELVVKLYRELPGEERRHILRRMSFRLSEINNLLKSHENDR